MYKFGSDGYVAWFGTIEIIAEDLGAKDIRECGKNVETLLKENPRFFSEQLLIDVKKLKNIYEYIKSRKKCRFTDRGDTWTIDIPKVLAFMDEWTSRVFKEIENAREGLPSDSGKSRAEQSREEKIASLRKGEGGAGAGLLGMLAQEFATLTGRAAFNRVRNPQFIVDTLGPILKERGYDACLAIMKERITEVRQRTGKPPANISYFIPIFKDESAFRNGHPPPAQKSEPKRMGGPASMSDLAKGLVPPVKEGS